MTTRLYYQDATLLEFEATVLDRADDGRRVYLDRSAFYPTSGGQPNDTGTLAGIRVLDVVDEEERIAHLLAEPLTTDQVHGQVDRARRRDFMEQHTGQHLLSAVFEELFGWRTMSVHFTTESATIDLAAGAISAGQAQQAETRANQVVRENRPVTVTSEDAATATGLRKGSDRRGMLRIITIADLDRSACGGTHVGLTGEIGSIQLRKIEKAKQLIRVEFLCGGRAVTAARFGYDLLAELAGSRSAAIPDLPALLEKERGEFKAAGAARRELEQQVAKYRAAELHAAAVPNSAGVRWLVDRRSTGGAEALRPLAQAVTQLARAVLVATVDQPPTILLASTADSGVDAGELLKAGLLEVGGRGGGSPRVAQGSVPDQAALARLTARLLDG
ncbi:MAG: DHHA1 domain-containing protein [Gemmatimonadota bacterium]